MALYVVMKTAAAQIEEAEAAREAAGVGQSAGAAEAVDPRDPMDAIFGEGCALAHAGPPVLLAPT